MNKLVLLLVAVSFVALSPPTLAQTYKPSGVVPALSLWRAPPLPHNAVVVRDDVPTKAAGWVDQALAGLHNDPDVDQSQFHIDKQHFELANNGAYKLGIDFLRRYDAAIGLWPTQIKQPKCR